MNFDYSLYLVTDRSLTERNLTDIVAAAVRGGVTCVQLREKELNTKEFITQAKELVQLLRPLGIPLIINDRVDVALASESDGVHLGQSDMPIQDARKIVGKKMIIGISAESPEDAIEAEKQGADYIGVSPVFSTDTKKDTAPPLGLSGLSTIRTLVDIPLVGIGGINADNCDKVILHGADGVAVVSYIMRAQNPQNAATNLLTLIQKNRAKK